MDSLMMGCRVMLGKITSLVGGTRMPENVKLSLRLMILEPIEVYVHSFVSFLIDCVIDNPTCCVVVGLQWCGWLWVAQFFQGCTDGADGFCIKE